MYKQIIHHGNKVWVWADFEGMHKDVCMCYSCKKFHPDTPENCPIAQGLFEYCVKNKLVTPVWECPDFEERDD